MIIPYFNNQIVPHFFSEHFTSWPLAPLTWSHSSLNTSLIYETTKPSRLSWGFHSQGPRISYFYEKPWFISGENEIWEASPVYCMIMAAFQTLYPREVGD